MSKDLDPALTPPSWPSALPRIAIRLLVIGALVYGASQFYHWAYGEISALEVGQNPTAMLGLLLLTIAIYAVVIAIPFIPAIEIALALLLMNGPSVAPFVYAGTIVGLMLAFTVGRLVSLDWLHAAFRDLHMLRACTLLTRIKTQPPQDRLNDMADRLPASLRWLVVDYRYVTLAILINIPGNVAIGGGGGILLLAGLSRLFRTGWVLLTLVLATAPVPLLVWVLGTDVLL